MRPITETLNTHLTLSITMLKNIINRCPEDLWIAADENESIWKRVLHVLESIDFWCDDFSEYQFNKLFPEFSPEMDINNKSPLTKDELLDYLDLLQTKLKCFFEKMDDTVLSTNSKKHPCACYLDIIISQIRHIQINLGYCNEKFNSKGLKSPEWLGYNE